MRPRPLQLPAAALALAFSTLGSAASAQDPDEEAAATTVEEEITVVERALSSETTSSERLDREELDRAVARSAADVLADVNGLHLVSAGARGGASHAQIRGGDPNFSVVLLDGIPLNDSTDTQGGALNLGTLPLSLVDSVEVIRGPHSYFFGTSAVAGVVNLSTGSADGDGHGRLSVEGGSFSLLHGALSYGGGGATTRYFVGLDYEDEEGTVADDGYDQASLLGNIVGQLSEGARLRFVLRHADLETLDYPESSGGPVFGSGELRSIDGENLAAGLDLQLTTSDWRHGGALTLSRLDSRVESPAVAPLVPPSIEDRGYERTQLNWASETGIGSSWSFSTGAQLDREDARNESVLFLPPFFGGDVDGSYDVNRTTLGVFVEGTLRTDRVTLQLGARGDDPEDGDIEWSPRVGLRTRLGSSPWTLRASWSEAFKLPSFFGLSSPALLGGNPALLPETSRGADLGFEYEAGSGRAGITVFDNRYDQLIDFDFDSFMNVNRDRVDASGIEVSGRWMATRAVRLSLDATFQDVEDVSSRTVPLNQPDWFASLALDWTVAGLVDLRFDARLSDGSLDRQLPVPARDSVDGYEILGLGAVVPVGASWRLHARVDNLLDEDWEQFIGFPQPGRSGRLGITWILGQRPRAPTGASSGR